MGRNEGNPADVGSICPLHRDLFRHHVLAVCLSSMASWKPDRTFGCGDLGLGCSVPRERQAAGSRNT